MQTHFPLRGGKVKTAPNQNRFLAFPVYSARCSGPRARRPARTGGPNNPLRKALEGEELSSLVSIRLPLVAGGIIWGARRGSADLTPKPPFSLPA